MNKRRVLVDATAWLVTEDPVVAKSDSVSTYLYPSLQSWVRFNFNTTNRQKRRTWAGAREYAGCKETEMMSNDPRIEPPLSLVCIVFIVPILFLRVRVRGRVRVCIVFIVPILFFSFFSFFSLLLLFWFFYLRLRLPLPPPPP